MDIIEKIQEQIAHHRAELLRLESALEVIAEMGGKGAKKAAPMITVRKIIDHEADKPDKPKKKPAPRKRHKETPTQIDEAVIAYLKQHGPSRSMDIGKTIKIDSHRLWSRLWSMSKRQLVRRDDNQIYHLVQEGAASTPSSEAA